MSVSLLSPLPNKNKQTFDAFKSEPSREAGALILAVVSSVQHTDKCTYEHASSIFARLEMIGRF